MKKFMASCKKNVARVILGMLVLFIALLVTKLGIFIGLYFMVVNFITQMTGFEIGLARSLAVGLVAVLLVIMPIVISFFVFGASRRKFVVICIVSTMIFSSLVKYQSTHVFFSKETGKPIAFYIKTQQGYSFSREKGFDPLYGEEYQPITKEVVSEVMGEKRAVAGESFFDGVKTMEELGGFPRPSLRDEAYKMLFMRKVGELCIDDYDCRIINGENGIPQKIVFNQQSDFARIKGVLSEILL